MDVDEDGIDGSQLPILMQVCFLYGNFVVLFREDGFFNLMFF